MGRDLEAQRSWLSMMQQDPTVVVTPPRAESAGWGMPRLNYQWVNTSEWGGWSPLRGNLIPGTAIFVCDKPG